MYLQFYVPFMMCRKWRLENTETETQQVLCENHHVENSMPMSLHLNVSHTAYSNDTKHFRHIQTHVYKLHAQTARFNNPIYCLVLLQLSFAQKPQFAYANHRCAFACAKTIPKNTRCLSSGKICKTLPTKRTNLSHTHFCRSMTPSNHYRSNRGSWFLLDILLPRYQSA